MSNNSTAETNDNTVNLDAIADELGQYVTAYASDLLDPTIIGFDVVMVGQVVDADGDVMVIRDFQGYVAVRQRAWRLDVVRNAGDVVVVAGRALPGGSFKDCGAIESFWMTGWQQAVARGPEEVQRIVTGLSQVLV